MRTLLSAILLLAIPQTPPTPPSPPTPSSPPTQAAAAPAPRDANLPPSQAQAKAALETSPRHGGASAIKLPEVAAEADRGTRREPAALGRFRGPGWGSCGGEAARFTPTGAPAEAEMKKRGKSYEPHVFAGAGHGFLRAQDDRDGANLKATRE